jgi:HNH endonuclease.
MRTKLTEEERKERYKEYQRIYQSKYQKEYYQKNIEYIKEKTKNYSEINKEKIKENREIKKEKINENSKKWREKNKDRIKNYYQENKDKINEQRKLYKDHNRKKINTYFKNKRNSNSLFKLKTNIRTLVNSSFRSIGIKKNSKTEQILGCTIEEFKQYIESQFEPWMNWNNYGNWNGTPTEQNTAWDIDHIIPTSVAVTENELIKLNHYTNLKPLCSYTNRYIKRDKTDFT